MFDWLSGKKTASLTIDIHSHLIPHIDDGVKSLDESITILQTFEELGFTKVITTPHIYPEVYPNEERTILEKFSILKEEAESRGITLKLECAAEYFLDTTFLERVKKGEDILSFGDKYVLFETSFYAKPLIIDEAVFHLKSRGFKPVMAHPERYQYLENDFGWLKTQRENGVKMQVNLPSLVGAYGKIPKRNATKLLDNSMVDFLGSDIHRPSQISVLKKSLKHRIKKNRLLNDNL
ncbi:MAG: capsular biosynthesis protein [Cyclobacteriaceae bacterium]